MQESDLDFCDELRALAGWNQRREDWMLFLRLAPEGCFLGELDDRAAGTVTTIQYEQKIGWIGMLIVHPGCRGRGVATRLLEHAIGHLQERGVRTIKLDATPQGEPLYTRMGFRGEGRITRWSAHSPLVFSADPCPAARELHADDFENVVRADASAFGASRDVLLREVHREALATKVLELNSRFGGFAMLRPGANAHYLGPIVANHQEQVRELVWAVTAGQAPRAVIWDAPEIAGRELVPEKLGFKPQRTLTRMRLGPNANGAIDQYWGLIDPACG